MRTTLWFDSRNQQSGTLATLVACGQFTTCYNLLEYIYRLKTNRRRDGMTYFERLSQQYRQKVDFLEDRLKKDYEAFRQDPFWLYNRNGHSFDIKDFKDCTVDSFPFPEEEFGGLR